MPIHQCMLATILVGLVSAMPAAADCFQRERPADKNDPEEVFAYQGDAVLTQVGIDAAFSKIPEQNRLAFIRDGTQVDRMVRNIMKTEVIALDAMKHGFSEDPMVRERMIQAAHKALAEAWLDQLPENAPAADYEAMAREDYLAHPENYQTEEYLDVSQILIGTKNRNDEEALSLAREVRQRALDAPESFSDLVEEYSDDPGKVNNDGRYLRIGRGQTAKPFEDAAFALEKKGDISPPVLTDFGYHIIRLDKRYAPRKREFEEVREEAVAAMEESHKDRYVESQIKGLLAEGIVLPEGSVEVMLRRNFGENLENAPVFKQD